jgi:hypothetical protein
MWLWQNATMNSLCAAVFQGVNDLQVDVVLKPMVTFREAIIRITTRRGHVIFGERKEGVLKVFIAP